MDNKKVEPMFVENEKLQYTAENIMNFYENKAISHLLIINPDNPTGNFIEQKDIFVLLNWAKNKNITLIIDESFVDFSDNFEQETLLTNSILCDNPHLIVVKSISKSFGVPGLRLGILATANKDVLNVVQKNLSIWNINSLAEFYMQIYNKYHTEYIQGCKQLISERKRFENELKKITFLEVIPSQANYFCCKIKEPQTPKKLTKQLLTKYNILIKNCENKNGIKEKGFIRISIRNTDDNNKLIEALKNIDN